MRNSAVDIERFRRAYTRLRQDRTLFLTTLRVFESRHPRYIEVLEWVTRQEIVPLLQMFAPGQVAATIALALVLSIEESDRTSCLPTPEDGEAQKWIVDWERAQSAIGGPDYLLMWQWACDRLRPYQPDFAEEIERLVHEEPNFESLDRELTFFTIGLFFCIACETHAVVETAVQSLTKTDRPSETIRDS